MVLKISELMPEITDEELQTARITVTTENGKTYYVKLSDIVKAFYGVRY